MSIGGAILGINLSDDSRDHVKKKLRHIANNSTKTLRTVYFAVQLKDCPQGERPTITLGAPRDQCRIVGEAKTGARVEIPPNQTRAFRSETMDFIGLPPINSSRSRFFTWRVVSPSFAYSYCD